MRVVRQPPNLSSTSQIFEAVDVDVSGETVIANGQVTQLLQRSFTAPPIWVRTVQRAKWLSESRIPQDASGDPLPVAPLRIEDEIDRGWTRYPSLIRPAKLRAQRSKTEFSVFAFGPWPENFYHWSLEILPRIYYSLSILPNEASAEIVLPQTALDDSSHVELLSFLVTEGHQISVMERSYQANIGVVADTVVASGHYKVQPGGAVARDTTIHPDAFRQYREALLAGASRTVNVPANNPQVSRTGLVFLDRGQSARRPYNRDEILAAVRSFGALVVRPHELTRVELMSILRNTTTVVSPHGAGVTNTMFCQRLEKAIILMPETHVKQRALWSNMVTSIGARLIIVAGMAPEDYSDSDERIHRIDPSDLLMALEL